tara:strand:- start:529 stop:2532 length:2004 start_codon:yes stop_codon:yes gene_type:complete
MDNPIQTYLRETLPAFNPRYQRNDVQCAYAGSVSTSLAQGPGSINFIEGDTGIGKTLAYMLTLADWVARGKALGRQAVLSTYSRALQRQLMEPQTLAVVEDYLSRQGLPSLSVGLRMGRSNYACPYRLATALGYPSLDAVLADHRATDAHQSLAHWGMAGGLLLDIDESLLPDDVTLGDIALQPSDPLPEGVKEQFEDTQRCDIQIINHALLALDVVRSNAITLADAPSVFLLDEAEHFPGVAESMLSERLSFRRTVSLLRQHKQVKAAEAWEVLFERWQNRDKGGQATPLPRQDRPNILQALDKLSRARPGKNASVEAKHELEEAKGIARRIVKQIQGQGEGLVISYSPQYGYPSLVLLDSTAGGLLQAGAKARITILTSATLSDCDQASPSEAPRFDYLRRLLLLPAHSDMLGVMTAHQAHTFGHLDFRLPGIDIPPMLAQGGGSFQLNSRFAKRVWDDVETLDRKGRQLLLCVSYTDVAVLEACVPAVLKDRLVTHGPGVSLTELAQGMPENGILLTPAGWEGLSPQRDQQAFWSHIGIVRNPTPRPDPVLALVRQRWLSRNMPLGQARQAASASLHQEAQVQTLHKLRQGLGRALRHPDDTSIVTFYDPRFPTGKEVLNVKSQNWLAKAVPFRFRLALKRAQVKATENSKTVKTVEEKPVLIL